MHANQVLYNSRTLTAATEFQVIGESTTPTLYPGNVQRVIFEKTHAGLISIYDGSASATGALKAKFPAINVVTDLDFWCSNGIYVVKAAGPTMFTVVYSPGQPANM